MIIRQPAQVLETSHVRDLRGQIWEMERVSCPLCGHDKSIIAYHWHCPYEICPMKFLISSCEHCGFLFTNPRLSKSAIDQYYQQVSPYADDGYHPPDVLRPRFDRFIQAFHRHGVHQGLLLEIGCDKGQFLQAARKSGFQVEGIEPSIGAEIARQKSGIQVRRENFEDAELSENKYDCVVMLDVLEHMYHPLQCLQEVCNILVPGGLMLVKVPNVRHEHGIYPLLRGKSALRFGAHEHLSHFSMSSLTHAMHKANLEIIEWLGFVPIVGQGGWRTAFQITTDWIGNAIKQLWENWPDYHVSLVCLARKPQIS